MKKIVSIIAIELACFVSQAQTLTNTSPPMLQGPLIDLAATLSTATNWAVAPYAIYDTGTKKAGAGVTALYNLNANFATGVGLDYLNSEVWLPSGQVQFQAPIIIAQKVTLIPFGFTGIATPVSGKGSSNGSAVGLFGAGMALKINSHLDIFGAISKWTGFEGEKYYGGIAYKF